MQNIFQKIKIENGQIIYETNEWRADQDKSWTLNVADVRIIAGINRMNSDEDADILVFIDKTKSKLFITDNNFQGWENFKTEVAKKFGLNFPNDFSYIYDSEIIRFPIEIKGEKLYKISPKKWIRTTLAIEHFAEGELSDAASNYIENLNTH